MAHSREIFALLGDRVCLTTTHMFLDVIRSFLPPDAITIAFSLFRPPGVSCVFIPVARHPLSSALSSDEDEDPGWVTAAVFAVAFQRSRDGLGATSAISH